MLLGRPTFMHDDDADVDISEPLPLVPLPSQSWYAISNTEHVATILVSGKIGCSPTTLGSWRQPDRPAQVFHHCSTNKSN